MDTIVIITYKSGIREAKFMTDPELVELIIDGFDFIEEIDQVEFTGIIPTPQPTDTAPAPAPALTDERAMRNIIRNIGRTATKNLMEP
jgi:hypothetical protein